MLKSQKTIIAGDNGRFAKDMLKKFDAPLLMTVIYQQNLDVFAMEFLDFQWAQRRLRADPFAELKFEKLICVCSASVSLSDANPFAAGYIAAIGRAIYS